MPYIKQTVRVDIADGIPESTAGELNYSITQLIIEYSKNRTLNYQTINDVMGALEGAKLEFYRRVAAPYEDIKISENGDVY